MWYGLYNVLLILAFPLILCALLLKKRCRSGLLQRIGWVVPRGWDSQQDVLWIHAVSLGEVSAIVPFVTTLHHRYPAVKIIVSTVTETGREAVRQRLTGIATHCFLPLDYPWIVNRFITSLNPIGFLVVETELWPNLLRELARRGVPSVILNGRLSSRSFLRYRWIRPFMRQVLSTVSLGLLQSVRDEQRFLKLGASPDRMRHTGNMKFDLTMNGIYSSRTPIHRSTFGLSEDERLLIAGSTHPVEEEILLESYRAVSRAFPNAVLVLAPRHIERSDALAETIRAFGFPVVRRSRLPETGHQETVGPRVIILDTQGELAHAYGSAYMAFVGGTLVPVGGHNLLEPAAWGKPVYFGPHTDHCQEIADLLVESGGGIRVNNGQGLTETLMKGMQSQDWVSQIGLRARKVIDDNQGVVERNVSMVEQVVNFIEPCPLEGKRRGHS
ncbi:MAG: 3-deoxy-D-manno-octulosonic acid transferase [Nitrospira sp.]|nr:3-deoxy-D-manno-octulosonic acid transferase [Nitrospira sp.]